MLSNTYIEKKQSAGQPLLLLALILLAGLAIRVALLQIRWVNPDEGAHLLDAHLWLGGQVPIADFGSRQPFYVCLIVLFIKVFGPTLTAGRLLPLVSSLAVAALLYLFGKRWFSAAVGLTAALIYALLPFVVIWSTIVKTEQLTLLLATASMLLLMLGQGRRAFNTVISGLLAALAFYVRQPALYLPMAAILYLVISRRSMLKNIVLYTVGYVSVIVATSLYYLRYMSAQDILFSQLNPLNLIWNRLMHMLGQLPQQYSIVDNAGFRVLDQDMSYTLNSWYHALAFTLFILFGAFGMISTNRFRKGTPARQFILLGLCWSGFASLLYLYQTASRGFYSQYFTEILPPLLLMASVFIVDVLKYINLSHRLLVFLTIAGFMGIYITQRLFWHISPGMAGYLVVSIGGALLVYFFSFRSRYSVREITILTLASILVSTAVAVLLKRLDMPDLYRFILVCVVLYSTISAFSLVKHKGADTWQILLFVGFFYAAFYSGHLIGPRYEAIWSRAALKKVTSYLREHARPSDDVLSGGAIWTFESGLQPYLNVPHPTEFYKHHHEDFELTFVNNPPQYIIVDGYTERKFSRYWTFIKEQLDMNYEKVLSVEGSKYPIRIFQLIPTKHGESGFITEVPSR